MSSRPYLLRHAVFVDSSAHFALADAKEQNHSDALSILRRLSAERWHLVTSNFIVAETHALTLTRLGRVTAARVLDRIERSSTLIERVSIEDERRARAIIRQYADKDWSLTDATSFAVMERLGIDQAFAFDRNFAQFGWTVRQP